MFPTRRPRLSRDARFRIWWYGWHRDNALLLELAERAVAKVLSESVPSV